MGFAAHFSSKYPPQYKCSSAWEPRAPLLTFLFYRKADCKGKQFDFNGNGAVAVPDWVKDEILSWKCFSQNTSRPARPSGPKMKY
jgi:hypothetical protein